MGKKYEIEWYYLFFSTLQDLLKKALKLSIFRHINQKGNKNFNSISVKNDSQTYLTLSAYCLTK